MPGPAREVAVARGLLSRRDFVDPLDQGFKNGDDGVDGFGLVARVEEFVGANRLRESDDEVEEFFFLTYFSFNSEINNKKKKKRENGNGSS